MTWQKLKLYNFVRMAHLTLRSILAIDMSPFGKSLTLLPAMRALHAAYPKTLIVAATSNGTCELLRAGGLVDETIELGVIRSSESRNAGAIKRLVGLARRSRRYSFDLVLDFSPRIESQIVSRFMVRARTFTPAKLPRAIEALFEFGGVSRAAGRSASSDYKNVLEQAGVEIDETRFQITPLSEEDVRFERRLASSGSQGGELIVLLYAGDPESRKAWPLDSFGEIASRLANNFGARIVAADEPSDHAFTDALGLLLPEGAIKLSEPRALELVAAIARASIVITDEPAIAQMASELNTPVIEVADAMSRRPAPARSHRVVQGSSRSRVSGDEVYEVACEMIQESRSASLFQR